MNRALRRLTILVLAGFTAACQGRQAALDAHGPQAQAIADLFWMFLAILAAVWIVTIGTLLVGLARRRRSAPRDPLAENPRFERRLTIIVGSAVAATAMIVVALTVVSYASQKALAPNQGGVVSLRITGHQWWWEITYHDASPDRSFTTANELHVPVGEKVAIELESTDVIHSFWVPALAGKMDLIPGRRNRITIQADRPGVYWGQCAEFCGYQHAKMNILVIAEPRADFDRWRDAQIASAQLPDDPVRRRGLDIFVSKACVMCHQIRGTIAAGRVAPDLTHIGSRRTIAAGTLENTRGNLAAWIVDPQRIKPGANMPTVQLGADEIEPIARYLEGLK